MSVQELFIESFMEWVSMVEQPHTSLRSIIMRNAKRWLEWCKARSHWTLEQGKLWSDESCFTIWQSDGLIWV
jgi:hypothetical protein